jgi:hypothetical protein
MKQVLLALLMFFGSTSVALGSNPAKLVLTKEQITAPYDS